MNNKGLLKSLVFLLVFMVLIFSAHTAQAAFISGSTGADGVFNPTENIALDMPDGGVFHFKAVNIPAGVTVSFNKNADNTPVTILATGDVLIDGTITVSAKNGSDTTGGMGGPGGGDGGDGGFRGEDGLRGEGIGGGGGGAGRLDQSYAAGGGGGGFGIVGVNGVGYSSYPGGSGGVVYANERLVPLIGGSGGGGAGGASTNGDRGGGGGGGGGAILIASSGDITINGSILARGGLGMARIYWSTSGGGGGSGGAVRLIANLINGSGLIEARGQGGGNVVYGDGGSGHWGRVRLEAFAIDLTNGPNGVVTESLPYPVLPQNFPAVKIVKIGATDIIERPTALINGIPDVELPFEQENPISVVVEGVNIPDATVVTITVMPSKGETTTFTGTLSGTSDLSSVVIDVTLPAGFNSILHATVTYDAPIASLGGPIYADGEKVEKIRVSSTMGGASKVVYITESGKEVIAQI